MKKKISIKAKILIVGSFPKTNDKNIYGGQMTACNALINSSFVKDFDVLKLNSSHFTNPPPNFYKRSYLAIIRIIKFIYKLNINKPDIILLFIADQLSAYEKGLMILITKFHKKSVMVFPRAGILISQYNRNYFLRKFINFSFSKSDIFLCQGFSFKRFAINQLKFKESNAPIIPNWTAQKEHLQLGKKRNNYLNNNKNNILFLGWLENEKGIIEIIKAIFILKKKKYNFHVTFAGDGSSRNFLNNYIKENKLEDYVSLKGWADEKEKYILLKESNIFLLPSWNEGFPNALVESMSAGLACIASDVGMIPDFLKENETCILIKPKNVEEIVSALEKLFNDLIYRGRLSQNAYLFAKSNFTIKNGLKLLSREIKKLSY